MALGFPCPVVHLAPARHSSFSGCPSQTTGFDFCCLFSWELPSPALVRDSFPRMAHVILSAAGGYSLLFPSAAAKLVTKTTEAITLLEILPFVLQHAGSLVCRDLGEASYTVWYVRKGGEKIQLSAYRAMLYSRCANMQRVASDNNSKSKVASNFGIKILV